MKPVTWVAGAHTQFRNVLIVLALVGNGLFIGVAGYTLHKSRADYEQRAEQLTQSLSTAVAHSVTSSVQKIDLALLGVVDDLERQLEGGAIDDARSTDFVRRLSAHYPEAESFRVTDETGKAWLGPGNDRAHPLDLSGREWFQTQRSRSDAGLQISRVIRSLATGHWVISMSRRYVRPDGSFAGAVTTAVPAKQFGVVLDSIDIGKKGVVVIRDANLATVARVPEVMGGRGLDVGSDNASDELRQLFKAGVPHATYRTTSALDKVARTVTFRHLKPAPLVVIVSLSSQEYLSGWWNEVVAMLVTWLAFAGVSGFAGVALFRAFHKQGRTEARTRLLASVFLHNGEAILITDERGQMLEVNARFTQLTGNGLEDVRGQDSRTLIASRTGARVFRAIQRAVRREGRWQGEIWGQHKLGHALPTWLTVAAMRDARGRITHHIVSFSDMTVLKNAEERLMHMANTDALTRLPNRSDLRGRLEQMVAIARREGRQLAVLFIDLDRFKNVNDTMGHTAGDELLVTVAQRLKTCVRDSDAVARLGGDEFVVVLTGLEQGAAAFSARVAKRIARELSRAYLVRGQQIHSTPSIGLALYPSDGADGPELMKNADAAMYCAKAAGRNNFKFFTQAMNDAVVERVALENGLRQALAREEFVLHYQPQVDLKSGAVVGVEALVRWQHPQLGLVSPLKFIPLAEETGMIGPLGEWVLDHAIAQLAQWRERGVQALTVAVNISAHQLALVGFKGMVLGKLRAHGLPASALELEITESVAMQRPEHTEKVLHELRQHGIELAIDDFGTGYSSLSYLKRLPLNRLKLDRSFVRDIETDANDAAISAASIALAHNLGLAVVAEGVETAAQLEFLRSLGCDRVQGYYFSKPLPAAELLEFVEARVLAEA